MVVRLSHLLLTAKGDEFPEVSSTAMSSEAPITPLRRLLMKHTTDILRALRGMEEFVRERTLIMSQMRASMQLQKTLSMVSPS